MKLLCYCARCLQEQGSSHAESNSVEMRDDGLYSVTCDKGHTTLVALQQQKFEILFEFGVMALADGYSREAVTSMAASLERFYEFHTRVICIKHGIDHVYLNATWSLVKNQSERQFGAYLFAYLLDRSRVPDTIDEVKPDLSKVPKGGKRTWKCFRNDVVHKGYIPSNSESMAYGNLVYRHIKKLAQDLLLNDERYVETMVGLYQDEIYALRPGEQISTISIPTLISLSSGTVFPASLEEAMNNLKNYNSWLTPN